LPLARARGRAHVRGKFLQTKHVYVVDDDRDVRVSISFMLNAGRLQARPFASGPDLIGSLGDLKPGIVLLDIRMPEMDGFQVMEALARKGVDWPVIVMTGHGEVQVAVRAMKLGAVDFLEKPFGEDILMEALGNAFALLRERGRRASGGAMPDRGSRCSAAAKKRFCAGSWPGFPTRCSRSGSTSVCAPLRCTAPT
jgi:DNA-binding NtrC family response regulator